MPERLRPWYEAGLELVLAPDLARARREAASRPAARPGGRPASRPRGAAASGPASSPAAPRRVAPDRSVPDRSIPDRSAPDRSAAARPAVRPPAGPAAPTQRSLDLPAPWGGFRVPAAPRIAWTYFDLGLDLSGRADPRRRTLFRTLVRDLAWAQGTIAFWPVAVPDPGADAPAPRAELFWRGLDELGLRQVACFGRRALAVICPGADPSAVRHMTEGGHTVFILPGPGDLLELLPHERHRALRALAALGF